MSCTSHWRNEWVSMREKDCTAIQRQQKRWIENWILKPKFFLEQKPIQILKSLSTCQLPMFIIKLKFNFIKVSIPVTKTRTTITLFIISNVPLECKNSGCIVQETNAHYEEMCTTDYTDHIAFPDDCNQNEVKLRPLIYANYMLSWTFKFIA